MTTAEAPQGRARCAWASTQALARYHDEEWGVPVTQDRLMFEHVVLDAFQAGLSWAIILNKREEVPPRLQTASTPARSPPTARPMSKGSWLMPPSYATA